MTYFAWAAGSTPPKQARELKAGLDERGFNELLAVLLGGTRHE